MKMMYLTQKLFIRLKIRFNYNCTTFYHTNLFNAHKNVIFRQHVKNISSLRLTKNIRILSNQPVLMDNFKLLQSEKKPVVIILSWLMAKDKNVDKYVPLYMNQNCDVLHVSIDTWQALWPHVGGKIIAQDVVKFLNANQHLEKLFLHGFSVGAYVWGEILLKLVKEQELCQQVTDKICGQIWDSLTDLTGLTEGFPRALSPNNNFLRLLLKLYANIHSKLFYNFVTVHYINCIDILHRGIVKSPALLFVSKTDPVGTEEICLKYKDSWTKLGITVYWKCWNDSPHVLHFKTHPKEYTEEVHKLLDIVGLLKYPDQTKKITQ